MRRAFLEALISHASTDSRILLLTADLGYTVVEAFADRLPKQYFNVGVAEQNMVGMATGLAECGFIPFVYSITPFAVLRSYEFIRNGPVHHKYAVRIVGAGGGLEYGHDGISHYGIDDIGVLRIQPGITVVCPADAAQAQTALNQTWELPGPVYYRLGKNETYRVPGLEGGFELNGVNILTEGGDCLILALGSIAEEVLKASSILKGLGINCSVSIVSCLPAVEAIRHLVTRYSLVTTVEAHYERGGLRSIVAEIIAEQRCKCRLLACGVDRVGPLSGSQAYLYDTLGISAPHIAAKIQREIKINDIPQ